MNKHSVYAPIILFVYNRPWHTQQAINALAQNDLANLSDLVIYSDAPKSTKDEQKVHEVRNLIKNIKGFKSVRIIERNVNFGLAENIIKGVGDIINSHGQAIILEDDIITSPAYLSFMNKSLAFYKYESKVWHISGWNYPISDEGLGDAFLWQVMNCWGWATWADRWAHFDKDAKRLLNTWNKQKILQFDLDGTGVFWDQVLSNEKGTIDTWAIFWYASIYENGGLCLNPVKSYVNNIGHDGSGTHCGNSQSINSIKPGLCNKFNIQLPIELAESKLATERIKNYYKKQSRSISQRVMSRLLRLAKR